MGFRFIVTVVLIFIGGACGATTSGIADSLRQYFYYVEPVGNHYVVNQGVFSTVFNAQGKPCFPFKYRKITPGFDDCFIADNNILIDSNGTQISNFYGIVQRLDRKYKHYIAVNGNYITVYDAHGNIACPTVDLSQFAKGLVTVWSNPKNGMEVRDTAGNLVETGKPPVTVSENYIACRTADTAWLFTKTGQPLFHCRADDVRLFKDDCIAVKLYGLWALKDSTGKNITDYKYGDLREERYPHALESWNQLVSTKGKEIVIDANSSISNWGSWIQAGWKGDILDLNYKVVIKKGTYEDEDFVGDRFIVLDKDEPRKRRCYDGKTHQLTSFIAESYIGNGAYLGRVNGKPAIFQNGVKQLPPFRKIEPLQDSLFYIISNEPEPEKDISESGYATVRISASIGGQGLTDKNFRILLPMHYSGIQLVNKRGFFTAYGKDGYALYTRAGKKVCALSGWGHHYPVGNMIQITTTDSTILLNDTGIIYRGPGIACFFFPVSPDYMPTTKPSLIGITNKTGVTTFYDSNMRLVFPLPDKSNIKHLSLPPGYHVVAEKAKGIITLKYNDSLYFLNMAGKLLFGGRGFDGRNCTILEGEVAILHNEAGKFGALDAAGNIQLPFAYDGVYNNNNQPVFWNTTDTLRLDNTGNTSASLHLTARIKARLAESHNWYLEQRSEWGGIPAGLYLASGRKVAELNNKSGCYNFGIGGDYRWVLMLQDTGGTKMAVIDSSGKFVIPYMPRPDLAVLGRYTIVAVFRNQPSYLYTFDADSVRKRRVTIDSACKAAIMAKATATQYTNSEVVYGNVEGIGRAVIFPHNGKPLLEQGVDSIADVSGYLHVKKAGGWGIFNLGWKCPPICDSIVVEKNSGNRILYKHGRLGIFVNSTQTLIKPDYDTVYNPYTTNCNYVIARKDGKYLLMDNSERLLTSPFDSLTTSVAPPSWTPLRDLKGSRNGKVFRINVGRNGEIEEKELR